MSTERDLFEEEQSMVAMSFGDHIEELRIRLILALLGLAAGVVLTLIPPLNLGKRVMDGMQIPAQKALGAFHRQKVVERVAVAEAEDSFTPMLTRIPAAEFAEQMRALFPELPAPNPETLNDRFVDLPMQMKDAELIQIVESNVQRNENVLMSLAPLETAMIFFTVCLVAGLVIASPWVFYHLWAFVAAGLYRHERRYVHKYMPFSIGLFLAGVFLCYFGVLPMTLTFLLQFNLWLGIQPNLRITEWMGFATVLPLVFGLGFQTPLVMMFLSKIGVFRAQNYREYRKYAILLTVIMAAVLTPGPDVVSQLMLAIPMLGLYELGIVLVARGETKKVEAAI
ncbi:hypothetical protein BH23PLA1_BH23PLA1_20640 [soil metagenome]